MMILRTLVCSTLFVSLAFADSPAPAAPVAARPHTQLRVDTVKPALTRRDSLTLQGAALSEARGGWTYSAEAKTVANKIVITVDGSAEPGAVVAKNETPFKATVEVVELKDKRVGTYELEVRGGKGERLWVGSWVDGKVNEDTGCPRGETVMNRGSRSQYCAPIDNQCAPGRKATVIPISAGQPACVDEKR